MNEIILSFTANPYTDKKFCRIFMIKDKIDRLEIQIYIIFFVRQKYQRKKKTY